MADRRSRTRGRPPRPRDATPAKQPRGWRRGSSRTRPTSIDRIGRSAVHSVVRVPAMPGVIPCPTARSHARRCAVATKALRIHVRSHRDRREAIPRRGRHGARGRAARRRAWQDHHASIASSSSPTATARRSDSRSWPAPRSAPRSCARIAARSSSASSTAPRRAAASRRVIARS